MLGALLGGIGKMVAPALGPLGFLAAPVLGAIGSRSDAKSAAKSGAAIDRATAAGMLQDRFEVGKQYGLTPQESMGLSSAGGTGAATSILGNQAAQQEMQQREQAFAAAERAKDRMVQLRGQDVGLAQAQTSANASIASSGMMARASMYGSDVNARTAASRLALDREEFENVRLPAALRDAVTQAPEWKRMQILASMGVDNMMATSLGQMFGLNPMDPSAVRGMSQNEFYRMAQAVYGMQSNVFKEGSGASILGTQAADGYRDGAGAVMNWLRSIGPNPVGPRDNFARRR